MLSPEDWINVPDEVKCDQARLQYQENYDLTNYDESTVEYNNNVENSQVILPLGITTYSNIHRSNKSNATPRRAISISEELKVEEPPIIEHSFTRHRGSLFRSSSTSLRAETPRVCHPKKFTKSAIFLAIWIFCTVAFIAFFEDKKSFQYAAILKEQQKSYDLDDVPKKGSFAVILIVKGPFLTKLNELIDKNKTGLGILDIVVEVVYAVNGTQTTTKAEKSRHHTLKFISKWESDVQEVWHNIYIKVPSSAKDPQLKNIVSYTVTFKNVNSDEPVSFCFLYHVNELGPILALLISCLMAVVMIVLVCVEVIDRTLAAVLMATFSIALLALVGVRPSSWRIALWMKPNTLLLAFSIMLMTSIAAESGIYEIIAICIFKISKGHFHRVMHILWFSTMVFSACTNSLAAILFMTPVGIRVSENMEMDPVTILMTMVMFSNIGGAATSVSSLPNLIINFRPAGESTAPGMWKFFRRMIVGIILVYLQTITYLTVVYRKKKKFELFYTPNPDFSHQYILWRKTLDGVPAICADWNYIRQHLRLNLTSSPAMVMRRLGDPALPSVNDLDVKFKIKNKSLLIKSGITFILTLVTLAVPYFIQHLYMGWTSMMPAVLLLLLIDQQTEPLLHRIEWSTLIFLASIFIFAQAIDRLYNFSEGHMNWVLFDAVRTNDASHGVLKLLSIIVWGFGILSAFVNNASLTELVTPGLILAGVNCDCKLQHAPLLNALSFAVCLGGNGTLMGSVANILCAGVSDQQGYHMPYFRFLKFGMPIMLGNLLVAYLYLLFLLQVDV